MATFRPKKNLWEARRRLPDGRRISRYAETEEEAERLADLVLGVVRFVADEGTIREFVRLVVWPMAKKKDEQTSDNLKWALNCYILPTIGEIRKDELKLEHCMEVLDNVLEGKIWMDEDWKQKPTGGSAETVRTVRKHLNKITRLLAREGSIPYNYLEEIEPPEKRRREPILTAKQAYVLWQSCKDTPIGAPVFIAAFCGLRRGECLGVSADDVADDLLVRDQTVYRRKKGPKSKGLKNDSKERLIPLPKAYQKILSEYAKGGRDVCRNSDGSSMHPTSLRKMLLRECKKAKVPDCSLHSLRATFMTELESLGAPRSVIQALVGHKPEGTTDGYIKPSRSLLLKWMERLYRHASKGPGVQAGGTTSSILGVQAGSK